MIDNENLQKVSMQSLPTFNVPITKYAQNIINSEKLRKESAHSQKTIKGINKVKDLPQSSSKNQEFSAIFSSLSTIGKMLLSPGKKPMEPFGLGFMKKMIDISHKGHEHVQQQKAARIK